MGGFWDAPWDYAEAPQPFNGSAHSVSSDAPEQDRAEQVRKVAEEVARKPMPRPAPRRIGFR